MPLLMPETDTEEDKEPLTTADLDDLVWDEDPVPDSREYLSIHKIPRPAANPTPKAQPRSPSHTAQAT